MELRFSAPNFVFFWKQNTASTRFSNRL